MIEWLQGDIEVARAHVISLCCAVWLLATCVVNLINKL